ncbi:MFS transporter [Neorhizobium sp. NCHU2750]|uniref:MFS transporter n=1 Tax=Neorhizobium sp. NCHU2750 TaxID=1825976 RepID=UPI0013C52925
MDDLLSIPQAVLFIVSGSFFVSVARAMSLTFVAIILHRDFSMGLVGIGLLLGIGPLVGAMVSPFAGAWSDMIGRKAVLALVLGMLSLSITVMGFAGEALAYGLAYTTAAISVALFNPISKAIISDASSERERFTHFSWRYTASNLGWAIGPIVSVVAGPATPTGFFIAGTILAALLLFLAPVVMPTLDQTPKTLAGFHQTVAALRKPLRDRRLFCLICGGMLALSVFSHWSATLGPYLVSTTTNGQQTYAILVSINGIVVLLANPILSRMIARAGGLTALLTGCVMLCASQIGFASSTASPALITSMFLLSIAEVLVVCAEYVLVDSLASDADKGGYFGVHAISNGGSFLGPVIGSLTLASLGGPAMFLLFAFMAIASALVVAIGPRATRTDPEKQDRHN